MGLLLIRKQQLSNALPNLKRAVDGDRANVQFRYVYAVALASAGKRQQAVEQLQQALQLAPNSPRLLQALEQYRQ